MPFLSHREKNLDMLINLVEKANWYNVYDAIGYGYDFICTDCVGCADNNNCDRVYDEEDDEYCECSWLEPKQTYISEFNSILEQEKAGYRLVDGIITPIIAKPELESIEEAIDAKFQTVSIHIKKALLLYSDREKPDYENSIKESISAVEAMCCIITELSGPTATLGAALKRLEDSGVVIHGAMREAFAKLYGYTSDSGGIRHGGIDFANASAEDAKYMLVSCSAFVNYLIEKQGKAGGTM